MVALSSALLMKMVMILPTLLKIIAAKALFGLAMGMVSVVLSKLAILPLILSYTNKNLHPNSANNNAVGGGAAGPGSYRQGKVYPLYRT